MTTPTKPSVEDMKALIRHNLLGYPGLCKLYPRLEEADKIAEMAKVWVSTLDETANWLGKNKDGVTLLRQCLNVHKKSQNAKYPPGPGHLHVALDTIREAQKQERIDAQRTVLAQRRQENAQTVFEETAKQGDSVKKLKALAHLGVVFKRPRDPDNPYWPNNEQERAELATYTHTSDIKPTLTST